MQVMFFNQENHGGFVLAIDFTISWNWFLESHLITFWGDWLYDMICLCNIIFLRMMKFSALNFSLLLSDDSEPRAYGHA
jgi:hypothetical protein